jgi:multidrug resistance efflux pump
VRLATDALNQVKAGSTAEQIAAQKAVVAAAHASVSGIDAQIRNNIIIAPFSGTVASVHVKTGESVAANTEIISLNPASALQVAVYFSEIDITKIHVGDAAHVTLDAYGDSRAFSARVVTVDSAPSTTGGYKATLQFTESDSAITAGMTANITIPLNK